jgi:hypothetical protein
LGLLSYRSKSFAVFVIEKSLSKPKETNNDQMR